MTSTRPAASTTAQLARLGFSDATRAEAFLAAPALQALRSDRSAIESLAQAADPDLALLSLGRIVDAAQLGGIDSELVAAFVSDADFRERLVAVLGASEALAEHLIRHPQHWRILADEDFETSRPNAIELSDELVAAVRTSLNKDNSWDIAACQLRVAYRKRLLALAARDLMGNVAFEAVTSELADIADAVLEACLVLAEFELPADSAPCRLSIIAMGKCGGRELNYISDVDVIFVAEPGTLPTGELADEHDALQTATLLAKGVMKAANASTPEGSIWEVDPALRPEGKAGALVRTLASHVGYYERWAQTWEFQALLKARYAAGDPELGAAYVDAVTPFIWAAADRPDFVPDVQAMRRRVEEHLSVRDADRELKLGQGGLRDVEFSVQLLQLVHGRSDVMLRSPTTLSALEAMATWGYVGRDDASTLATAYRFLRTLEHRLQLYRLQRTHLMPDDVAALRRLGRSMGMRRSPENELTDEWQKQRRAVRRIHEKLFYRPLLNAVARLSPGEARLTRDAARERLTALGYSDPDGALRHLEALTAGVSRRAAIQRTLLPVMLGWFADAPNPDAGLLAFRRVSEQLGGTPWYLRLLRDEVETAERLAHVLATSRFASDLLLQSPDAVSVLSSTDDMLPRATDELEHEMALAHARRESAVAAIESIHSIRRRELFRIASADICGLLDVETVGQVLSDVNSVAIAAAAQVAISSVEHDLGHALPTRFAVIGLGRLGGNESGYGSDADVIFVHDPHPGADEQEATRVATTVANELKRLLTATTAHVGLELDADLRPEGRSGALVRSLASYAAYYARWSSPWEAQALLRARPLAGDAGLAEEFMQLIDPLRFPADGISETDLREIRRLKARMESERLPRGADPTLHVKLGRGGLSDVEWVAQLTQMRFAGSIPALAELRSTSTLVVLRAALAGGHIDEYDYIDLSAAWRMATSIRHATVLVTGRVSDQVPTEGAALAGVAHLLGYRDATGLMVEDYLRQTRRARAVVERLFYGWEPESDE